MKRPWYQRTTAYIGYTVAGFLVLGNLLNAYLNARAIVTPTVTLVGSAIVVLGLSSAALFLRRKRRTWILDDGQQVFPRKLGLNHYLIAIGALILLWMPRVSDFWVGSESALPAVGSYECRTGDWKLQVCRVETDHIGSATLMFNGPTHDSTNVIDTYAGGIQREPAGFSVALRNEFSPDPSSHERVIQTSSIVLHGIGRYAWSGVWRVADGSTHPFSMHRGSP